MINITHTCRNICESVISNHHSILLQYPNLKVSPIKGRTLLKLLIDSTIKIKVKKCSLCEIKIYNADLKFCFCCGSPVRERCIYDTRKELIKSKNKKKKITTITLENGLEIIKQEEEEEEVEDE